MITKLWATIDSDLKTNQLSVMNGFKYTFTVQWVKTFFATAADRHISKLSTLDENDEGTYRGVSVVK